MATLVLAAAGQALGGAAFGSGTLLAAAAGTAGALAGKLVDNALFGQKVRREGRRLEDLTVQTSTEGAAMPRVYGRVRLSGQVIWATQLEETVSVSTQGGKGGGSGVETTEYAYFANFAVGLCEGPIHRVGRIWADGRLLDQREYTIRVYHGDESQSVDALIEAKQGLGEAPAFRGTAYVVFDRIALESFGNRLPQLSFEVIRVVEPLEAQIEAITLIPGATELGYLPEAINRSIGPGASEIETAHSTVADSNVEAAIEELLALCPNLKRVALVVSWFGTDLRCGHCSVEPRVEDAARSFDNAVWSVNGLLRSDVNVVSQVDERPAFGGTPSDASVVALIQYLTSKGIAVTFYPFLMMDIPSGNDLPSPDGSATQPSYPWRGRITCDPSPEADITAYATAQIRSQVDAFVGTASSTDFAQAGTSVSYVGPPEWSWRRMILHYAHLCAAAGGVEAFLIGSELRGLTHLRDDLQAYPFVNALVGLASDVKAILGPGTLISYAADWSEFFGHQPQDGSSDAVFHLDPLWSSADIDFIGIDCYWPLSDWREGTHLDEAVASGLYDLSYLKSGLFGGEGYDWYYASDTDRSSQIRSDITDGAYGKPWVYRYKDLANWWSNQHFNRFGGVESPTATNWVPGSKQIWLTETGCPAVDRGSNQPNVFVDPKSSESFYPYFSGGFRDDLIQRRYLEAILGGFSERRLTSSNPAYANSSQAMLEPSNIFIWTFDARPYPEFPQLSEVWSDGENWFFGHWLNGRLGGVSIEGLIKAILGDAGFSDFEVGPVGGLVDGYLCDGNTTIRSHLEPLLNLFSIAGQDIGTAIRFAGNEAKVQRQLSVSDFVLEHQDDPDWSARLSDVQETNEAVRVVFSDTERDFEQGAVTVGPISAGANRIKEISLAISAPGDAILRAADTYLNDALSKRLAVSFNLPIHHIDLEPGDLVQVPDLVDTPLLRIERIEDNLLRRIDASVVSRTSGYTPDFATSRVSRKTPSAIAPPELIIMDLPLLSENDEDYRPYVAAQQTPWPGTIALFTSQSGEGYQQLQSITSPTTTGVLQTELNPGVAGLWDLANTIEVRMSSSELESQSDLAVFSGANTLAVATGAGWEILQFATANLISDGVYQLSRLLRGQLGTEAEASLGASAGATVVLISSTVAALQTERDQVGVTLAVKAGAATRSIDSQAYTSLSVTPTARGQQPLAPAHLRAYRQSNGDHLITWVRRTRLGGDSWAQYEVPLGESAELYELQIHDGTAVVRTVSLSSSSFVYTQAMQVEDFSTTVSSIDVSISQISETYGPGALLRKVIYV